MEFKLILKKIYNTLTAEERQIFDAWYNESNEHRIYFHRVKKNYLNGLKEVDLNKGWRGVTLKIGTRKKRQTFFKYAAAIAMLFATGLLWLYNSKETLIPGPEQSVVTTKNTIEVGTDKATLTLDDGSQIALEKGGVYETEKASSNGERLVYKETAKTAEKTDAQNILTIPRGGQFFVILADGTKIWVNSETQLKYPVTFTKNKTREVELVYGEAYFEVSPSSEHNGSNFIVHTEGQEVEVLGTEFNIKAYKTEDQITTTLVEGKVLVENGRNAENLAPGQQSQLNRSSQELTTSSVDVFDEVSWKRGFFSFKKRSLEDIMKVLSRWYDVDVVFQNEEMKELTFNGIFRRTQNIDEILNIMRNTNEVNYEINKKTITMK